MANCVLVHGGMIGGDCWRKVRPKLEKKGHRVFAPTLTGLGEKKHLSHRGIDLDVHILDVLNLIIYEELDDVYLVGHSYGGVVITGVADRIPDKIRKLIYVAAVLPKNGESMFDAVGPEISSFLSENARRGNGWQVDGSSPENYGITSPEDAEWFLAMSTPHPLKTFQQKLYLNNSSPRDMEKIYIQCLQDSALKPMARRAKAMNISCYELDCGHFPMITAPEALSDLLDSYMH